ncbi:hypothetical protein BSL78_11002 [Apostichopus japonicus]|uniref:Sushi domain-containing protein n=1 Tax=Stichopus japonicus TaxID=307972 RepID=A0A2G8KW11_STIJA|nr:hypothetical protein BSL78_11002 [Apostichopus japonicus]
MSFRQRVEPLHKTNMCIQLGVISLCRVPRVMILILPPMGNQRVQLQFKCNDGYTKCDDLFRTCGSDGIWSSEFQQMLECTETYFTVTISKESLAPGTSASVLLGDQTCDAYEPQDPNHINITSDYSSCGKTVTETSVSVEYRNVVIDADYANLAPGDKILLPVMCSIAKEDEIVPQSHFDDYILSKSISQTGGAATFDFLE